MLLTQILSFILGAALAAWTLLSAVKTFVLPRSAQDFLVRLVFISIRQVFNLVLKPIQSYERRDRIMAFYAPFSLLALLPTWLVLIAFGYQMMYWALGVDSWMEAYRISGSSLLTLGIASNESLSISILIFTEATIGLILVALLISYLPTMYSAFARRETTVTMLEVRAGDPPSAVTMLVRYHSIQGLEDLSELWKTWETWFADIQESHTSLPALVFFRSPMANHSWVTAAGAVLDTASLTLAAVDIPRDAQAALCIRGGFLTLRSIAAYFGYQFSRDPHFPADPISITREEFDQALEQIEEGGVPLKNDREQAWLDFAGWRVNYDDVLIYLAGFTMAPVAPWSSDRTRKLVLPSVLSH